jgi:hypothetical protein
MTIKRAEGSGQPPAAQEAVAAIRVALEAAGVIFVEENGEGPGVRLRKPKPAVSDEAALPEMPKGAAKDYDGSPM